MHVEFVEAEDETEANGIIAEAEIHFDNDLPEPFTGKKLIGFTLRKSKAGKVYVNLPGRAFGVGVRRYYVNFIQDGGDDSLTFVSERKDNDGLDDVKRFILHAWNARGDI
jgi:hypothetical protein